MSKIEYKPTKKTTIEIPVEYLKKIKIICINRDINISNIFQEIIEYYFSKKKELPFDPEIQKPRNPEIQETGKIE